MAFRRYNGTYQTTFIDYGPAMEHALNSWPPHQHIAMPQAMRTLLDNGLIPQLPKRISGSALVQDGRPCCIKFG
ncbi:hypothetical protein BGW80DRAFT_1368564, partial [Lactifluus volemus]